MEIKLENEETKLIEVSNLCKQCNKSFATSVTLKRHIKTVHDKVKDYKCDSCEKRFGSKTDLKRHKNAVHNLLKPFECKFCRNTFSESFTLKKHIKTVHQSSNTASKVTPIKCPRENCTFEGSQIGLAKHLKKHTDCEKCGKSFSGSNAKRDLNRHLKTHEPKPIKEKKVHKCDICSHEFEWNCHLKQHKINCEKRFNLLNNARNGI